MKNTFILLTISIFLLSCHSQGTTETAKSEPSLKDAAQRTATQQTFTEGKIDVKIYFPGNPLAEILNKVDPAKGNVQQQIETYAQELSAEDAVKVQKVMSANPILAMQIMFAPLLRNELFVRGDQTTAKCDGLMYHLENTLNGANETGTVYLRSTANENNQVTFGYDKEYFQESSLQTSIDASMYDRTASKETEEIAGYTCQKAIYTLKDASSMMMSKLEVWTSEQMPRSLNFIHPFYVDEAYGIMKIALYQDSQPDMPMVYEFTKVTPTTVSDADMEIQQSQPLYDGKSDNTAIAAKIMQIMFGG